MTRFSDRVINELSKLNAARVKFAEALSYIAYSTVGRGHGKLFDDECRANDRFVAQMSVWDNLLRGIVDYYELDAYPIVPDMTDALLSILGFNASAGAIYTNTGCFLFEYADEHELLCLLLKTMESKNAIENGAATFSDCPP